MTDRLLTPEEAAAILSVSPKSIRAWLRSRKLKGVKAGRLWRVREEELHAFLFESETTQVTPTETARCSALGFLSDLPGSVDDFLREKHAENEEEERHWRERTSK